MGSFWTAGIGPKISGLEHRFPSANKSLHQTNSKVPGTHRSQDLKSLLGDKVSKVSLHSTAIQYL